MLLAFVSEVLKHSFLVDWFTRLPHHGLQDVRALCGHGCHMAVIFEVEDRPLESDVLLAQDAGQHLSRHVAGLRHRILEQFNQCFPDICPVRMNSAVCGGQRLTSGRYNRIIQKQIEGGWAYLQPAWSFRRRLQMQLDTTEMLLRAACWFSPPGACAQ